MQSSINLSKGVRTVWLKFEAQKDSNNAAYQLIRLRRKLGLTTSVPIHAPEGKLALERHLKDAENEQVVNIRNINLTNQMLVLYYCFLCSLHIKMQINFSIIVY